MYTHMNTLEKALATLNGYINQLRCWGRITRKSCEWHENHNALSTFRAPADGNVRPCSAWSNLRSPLTWRGKRQVSILNSFLPVTESLLPQTSRATLFSLSSQNFLTYIQKLVFHSLWPSLLKEFLLRKPSQHLDLILILGGPEPRCLVFLSWFHPLTLILSDYGLFNKYLPY